MLLFSTVLEINSKMTRDNFMELIVEWNANTPHAENRISGLVWNGKTSFRWGTDNLWLAVEEYAKQSTLAGRYEKKEKSGIRPIGLIPLLFLFRLLFFCFLFFDERADGFNSRLDRMSGIPFSVIETVLVLTLYVTAEEEYRG